MKQFKMSHSPATPDKSTVDAAIVPSKVPVPSLDKLTSTSKVKQASFHEPSPASTYGDTAAGDSFPATPQEAGEHGESYSCNSHFTLLPTMFQFFYPVLVVPTLYVVFVMSMLSSTTYESLLFNAYNPVLGHLHGPPILLFAN